MADSPQSDYTPGRGIVGIGTVRGVGAWLRPHAGPAPVPGVRGGADQRLARSETQKS